MTKRVAVYGTLKRGKSADLADWHPDNVFVEERTLQGYDMYTQGWYPMCVPGTGTILVEVWDVSEKCMDVLDGYEGHPDLFKRTYVKDIDAEMYVYNHDPNEYRMSKRILSGVWE
jgi:gamma-glutamylcyclotransferase (GGCT)/AIG2-like uncharacterized protein YtfP